MSIRPDDYWVSVRTCSSAVTGCSLLFLETWDITKVKVTFVSLMLFCRSCAFRLWMEGIRFLCFQALDGRHTPVMDVFQVINDAQLHNVHPSVLRSSLTLLQLWDPEQDSPDVFASKLSAIHHCDLPLKWAKDYYINFGTFLQGAQNCI